MTSIESIQSDFEFLDDWEDRYRYVIELGRELAPLAADEKHDLSKVRGCASQVWLVSEGVGNGEQDDPVLRFRGESDALIVQGLIAILLALYNDRPASEIAKLDAAIVLAGLGLEDHLTPQRSNGLKSMIERIRMEARAAMTAG